MTACPIPTSDNDDFWPLNKEPWFVNAGTITQVRAVVMKGVDIITDEIKVQWKLKPRQGLGGSDL